MNQNTVDDFQIGDNVRYIPNHAHGDANHPDCENGVVSSKNHLYVFVKYHAGALSGVATMPDQLMNISPLDVHKRGLIVTSRLLSK